MSADSVSSNNARQLGTQSVYASAGQTYSPADLTAFQVNFNLVRQNISGMLPNVAGVAAPTSQSYTSACLLKPGNCQEGNLDVQYLMGVAQNLPTTYYVDSSTDFLLTWAMNLLQMDRPPLVNSISYMTYEVILDQAYINTFDESALMLSAMGVTIIVCSGDDGVGGFKVRLGKWACDYFPMWPASSPYVLSVGGTQGPEMNAKEIACSSSTSGTITSGGGFSNLYPMPAFQKSAISNYISTYGSVSTTNLVAPYPGYNSSGRGFPDVALLAKNYVIKNAGSWIVVSGTVRKTYFVFWFTSMKLC
jgi:tripeptidyl-peptidase-1